MTDLAALQQAKSLSGRDQVYALIIGHPSLEDPIRVVGDTVKHTVDGNEYIPLAFRAELPQEREGQIRQARLRIDNVGQELMKWVHLSDGGRGAVMTVYRLIPPASGETESSIDWEVTMNVGIAEVTNLEVVVTLTEEPTFDRRCVLLRHSSVLSPGLF